MRSTLFASFTRRFGFNYLLQCQWFARNKDTCEKFQEAHGLSKSRGAGFCVLTIPMIYKKRIKSFVPVFFLDCCFKVGNNLKGNEDSYCAVQYVPVWQMASALRKRDYPTLSPVRIYRQVSQTRPLSTKTSPLARFFPTVQSILKWIWISSNKRSRISWVLQGEATHY